MNTVLGGQSRSARASLSLLFTGYETWASAPGCGPMSLEMTEMRPRLEAESQGQERELRVGVVPLGQLCSFQGSSHL